MDRVDFVSVLVRLFALLGMSVLLPGGLMAYSTFSNFGPIGLWAFAIILVLAFGFCVSLWLHSIRVATWLLPRRETVDAQSSLAPIDFLRAGFAFLGVCYLLSAIAGLPVLIGLIAFRVSGQSALGSNLPELVVFASAFVAEAFVACMLLVYPQTVLRLTSKAFPRQGAN